MSWFMVGAAAVTVGSQVIGGIAKSNSENINQLNQTTAQWQDRQLAFENNAADNKTIAETNLQNSIRTGFKVGILNVQRAQSRKEAAAAGITLGREKLFASGAAEANAAASGSIGSSVDAVVSDIEMQAEGVDAAMVQNDRILQGNFDMELHDILQAGDDAIMSPVSVNSRTPANPQLISSKEVWGSAIVSTAGSMASQYMSMGFGKTAPPRAGGTTLPASLGSASMPNSRIA